MIDRPNLTLAGAAAFLGGLGIPFDAAERDRRLDGLLLADRGAGMILIDADLPAAEARFTLAHELAHFLREYWLPRRRAEARLGKAVLEVFDGDRKPTADERIAGLFRGVRVGPHAHLLRRDGRGRPLTFAEATAEAAADELAYELLAPADAFPTASDGMVDRLTGDFGLPRRQAMRYAHALGAGKFSR